MEDVFIQNALAYASGHQLELAERLGFGIHGIIFATRNKPAGGQTAVKVHREKSRGSTSISPILRLNTASLRNIMAFKRILVI